MAPAPAPIRAELALAPNVFRNGKPQEPGAPSGERRHGRPALSRAARHPAAKIVFTALTMKFSRVFDSDALRLCGSLDHKTQLFPSGPTGSDPPQVDGQLSGQADDRLLTDGRSNLQTVAHPPQGQPAWLVAQQSPDRLDQQHSQMFVPMPIDAS